MFSPVGTQKLTINLTLRRNFHLVFSNSGGGVGALPSCLLLTIPHQVAVAELEISLRVIVLL